jgi:hypothetical protein
LGRCGSVRGGSNLAIVAPSSAHCGLHPERRSDQAVYLLLRGSHSKMKTPTAVNTDVGVKLRFLALASYLAANWSPSPSKSNASS